MTRYKKDKNNLYYKWKKVKGVNPDDIEIIENNFIKIKNTLYKISNFGGKEAEIEPLSVDTNTFEEIDNNYYRDKKNVYFYKYGNLQKLKNANVKNFKMLKESFGFGKDQSNIYYKGYKLEQVDKDSFEILDETYDGSIIKDKNGIYILTEKSNEIKINKISENQNNIDFNSFIEITNNPYIFKDKNAVYTLNTDDDKIVTVFSFEENYYKLNKLNNTNPKKFDMIEFNYFKDDKNIFYFSDKEKIMKKIENADIESFEVLNDDYSKDKNTKYYHGERIK